jgi:hypothetical protein
MKRMVQQNDQLEITVMYFYNCDPIEVIEGTCRYEIYADRS